MWFLENVHTENITTTCPSYRPYAQIIPHFATEMLPHSCLLFLFSQKQHYGDSLDIYQHING